MDIRKFFGPSPTTKKTGTAAVKEPSTAKKNEETKKKGGQSLKCPVTQKKNKTTPVKNKDKKPRTSPRKKYSFESDDDDVEIIETPSDEDVIKNSQESLKGKTKTNGSFPSKSRNTKNSPKKGQVKIRNKNNENDTNGNKVTEKLDQRKKIETSSLNVEDDIIEIESVTSTESRNSRTNSQTRTTGKDKEKNKKSQVVKNHVQKDHKQEIEVRKSPRKQSTHTKQDKKTNEKHKQLFSDEEDEDNLKPETDSDNTESEEVIVTRRKRARSSNSKSGKKNSRVLDSDSEEDPLPKEKPKAKRKKKEVTYIDDSDGEKPVTALDKFVIHNAKPPSKEEKSKKSNVEVLKPVNVSDFFGTTTASRSDRVTAVGKRKHEEVKQMDVVDVDLTFDEEMHDDEDFLKTLDQLDGPNVKKVKQSETKGEKLDSAVESVTVSLSSKLSAKVKSQLSPTKDSPASVNNKSQSKSPVKVTAKSPAKKSPVKRDDIEVTKITEIKDETTPLKTKVVTKTQSTPQNSKLSTPASKSGSEKNLPGSEKKDDDGFGTKRIAGFKAFKERGGPLALGSKEIPEGGENCLEGLTFVITGVLDSIERDDAKTLIERHGGKVTGNISRRTSYVVVGRDPGESKLTKANDLKVKQLNEDELFDLIRTLPGKTSKYEIKAKEQCKKEASAKKALELKETPRKLDAFRSVKDKTTPSTPSPPKEKSSLFTQLKDTSATSAPSPDSAKLISQSLSPSQPPCDTTAGNQPETLLWVDKHKPTTLKNIIGQQGDKSNAKKLLNWLTSWHENVIVKGLKPPSGFFGKGDGAGNRAALLSGPPGIGKTTTATLVCKEAKFSYVELNASDCRSKRSLKEVVSESLNNQTLVDYMGDNSTGCSPSGNSHCLIMDEVDGMAGNEDRGGLQELVQLIKNTKIPIICICNDRNSMKMRTLSNYCLDLRFQRPRLEQIKGAMMSLAFKEGLKIQPAALNEIIIASNHDIRQIIHNMSMWSASDKNMTFEQVKSDAAKAQKDIKLGPFDVCRKVFVDDEETRKMTINDKSDLFFHDYSFGPLFVHENYPNIIPKLAKGNQTRHLSCLARTIDSLCDGDLIDKLVRKDGNWNLLPTQAMFASVIPGEVMRGSFPQMSAFPQWLGKFSSTNKTHRILQELGLHMRLQTSCDKRGLTLDYLPALRTSLTSPLTINGADGVPDVIKVMDDYDIIKEDFDNILEVTKWPNSFDPMSKLDSKTKAAFTRQYNKEIHLTPYATGSINKKRRNRGAAMEEEEAVLEGEGAEETTAAEVDSEKEEEESLEENTMIKAKKATSSKAKAKKTSEQKAGAGGKGKGKAKGGVKKK